FFFKAEDGIRYKLVTGVQTCALPIWKGRHTTGFRRAGSMSDRNASDSGRSRSPPAKSYQAKHLLLPRHLLDRLLRLIPHAELDRSEERRVGGECRGRGGSGACKNEAT